MHTTQRAGITSLQHKHSESCVYPQKKDDYYLIMLHSVEVIQAFVQKESKRKGVALYRVNYSSLGQDRCPLPVGLMGLLNRKSLDM